MFALKARPASLASRRSHTTRRSSQIVRVAEFERKTAEKMPKISVPAVDGGETPLSILNDGADAFAELVALNKPKQSVNRPQKVRSGRRGDGDVGEKSTNERREEGENRIGEWLDGMPTTEGVMMMRAIPFFRYPFFESAISHLETTTHRRSSSARTRRSRTAFLPRPRSTRRWSTRGPARSCGCVGVRDSCFNSSLRLSFRLARLAHAVLACCLRAGAGGIECRKKRDVLGHFRSARHPLYQHRGCSVRGGEKEKDLDDETEGEEERGSNSDP